MKSFLKEYVGVFMYTICGILIILGSYNIIININHARFLNKKVVVSDIDNNYKDFKENILDIEKCINSSKNKTSISKISNNLSLLKNGGIYIVMPNTELNYIDLYNLNTYFLDTLINDGWLVNLRETKEIYKKNIQMMIDFANYINKELLNNSNFHYDVKNNEIRSSINEEYKMILNNYKEYSSLLLGICEGDIDA